MPPGQPNVEGVEMLNVRKHAQRSYNESREQATFFVFESTVKLLKKEQVQFEDEILTCGDEMIDFSKENCPDLANEIKQEVEAVRAEILAAREERAKKLATN